MPGIFCKRGLASAPSGALTGTFFGRGLASGLIEPVTVSWLGFAEAAGCGLSWRAAAVVQPGIDIKPYA
jgi:hypothetical protein